MAAAALAVVGKLIKKLLHLLIIADPSHGTGAWDLVSRMAQAAIAAGADGFILEVNAHPEKALSVGYQSLSPKNYLQLTKQLKKYETILQRTMMVSA